MLMQHEIWRVNLIDRCWRRCKLTPTSLGCRMKRKGKGQERYLRFPSRLDRPDNGNQIKPGCAWAEVQLYITSCQRSPAIRATILIEASRCSLIVTSVLWTLKGCKSYSVDFSCSPSSTHQSSCLGFFMFAFCRSTVGY